MNENKFREPTVQELKLLKKYYLNATQDEDTANSILQKYWFTAINSSRLNSCNLTGTVIIAVYGMIEFYELFHVQQNKIKRILLYDLNLEQSMQLISILHTAITLYMRRLGFVKKPHQKEEKNR